MRLKSWIDNFPKRHPNWWWAAKWAGGLIQTILVVWLVYLFDPKRYWERWDLEITGALPIHVLKTTRGPEGIVLHDHELAFVVEVRNDSSHLAPVSMALIDGCIKVDGMTAQPGLRREEQFGGGLAIDEIFRRGENAVQRISLSGSVEQPGAAIAAKSRGYVGILFPFRSLSGVVAAPGSVSLQGDCKDITVASTQPTAFAVFPMATIDEKPTSLRQEFATGQLRLSLLVGTKQLTVDQNRLKPLQSVSLETWLNLDLAAMYNNPETAYPPTRDNRR